MAPCIQCTVHRRYLHQMSSFKKKGVDVNHNATKKKGLNSKSKRTLACVNLAEQMSFQQCPE